MPIESEKRLEEIKKWFTKTVSEACRPRCPFCHAKLSNYWFYEPHGFRCLQEFQICPECKEKVVKK